MTCVNGVILQEFKLSRALRQGCPLAPLLFVLPLEPLLCNIRAHPEIVGIKLPNGNECRVKGLADDLFAISSNERPSLEALKGCLRDFTELSEAAVNWSKSTFFLPKQYPMTVQWGMDRVPVDTAERFLGVQVALDCSSSQEALLQERLKARVSSWGKARHLSLIGRALAVMASAFALLWYVAVIRKFSPTLLKAVKAVARRFIWKPEGDPTRGVISKVAWHTICAPREEGGLSLVDPGSQNSYLLARWIVRIAEAEEVGDWILLAEALLASDWKLARPSDVWVVIMTKTFAGKRPNSRFWRDVLAAWKHARPTERAAPKSKEDVKRQPLFENQWITDDEGAPFSLERKPGAFGLSWVQKETGISSVAAISLCSANRPLAIRTWNGSGHGMRSLPRRGRDSESPLVGVHQVEKMVEVVGDALEEICRTSRFLRGKVGHVVRSPPDKEYIRGIGLCGPGGTRDYAVGHLVGSEQSPISGGSALRNPGRSHLPVITGHCNSSRLDTMGDAGRQAGREALVPENLGLGLGPHFPRRKDGLGYYYAYVYLGTPPKRFALIVDTGSTVLYVPCSSCLKCGTHQDLAFAPKASTTYRRIPCSRSCDQCSDDAPRQCMYQRHYAEDSTSKGLLASDVIGFGEKSTIQGARINFGCELFESGDIYLQRADGIIGLGRGTLSVVDQLVNQQAMEDAFSICYGGMGEVGGALLLGSSLPPPDMKFTLLDLQKSYYYCVVLEGVRLDGETLDVPADIYTEGYGAVLDSGTTFAYLPSQAFHAFKKKVVATIDLERVDGPDPNFQDICFAGASSDTSELGDFFPTVEFVFQGNVSISLAPENYLFMHKKRKGAYCFGFFKNPDRGTLIGGIAVRNMLVTYDRANAKVGFASRKCSTLLDNIPPVIPSTSYGSTTPPDSVSSMPASDAYPAQDSQSSPESNFPPALESVSLASSEVVPLASDEIVPPGSSQLAPWSAPPSTPLFVTPNRPSQESRPLQGVDHGNLSQPDTSEQVKNGGNETPLANTTSPPREVCPGCALKILVNITLLDPVTFDTELRSGFIDDMARELGLAVPQVVVMKYNEDMQCIQCVILPEKSRLYLPANVTMGLVNRLQNKTAVHFRDAVGDYNVTSIYVMPVTAQSMKARCVGFGVPLGGVLAVDLRKIGAEIGNRYPVVRQRSWYCSVQVEA
ncbi:hypothetical protein CBR_g5596 [Chara braunii]|uniref:Peptidase A1 domain-containing protein n=1 Tax=Chara braunii TaxID=69332 RepID=A0A388JRM3_CHABU|nr:hypothetical protein CBR_g5596 [Chara braunii]|eukprot:GBG60420.1 hypothetical protein CBR_g5596 [Chara braunii]